MPELGRPDSPAAAPALARAPALSSGAPEIGGIAVGKVGPYGIAGNNVGELSGADRRARCGRCKSIDFGHSPHTRGD